MGAKQGNGSAGTGELIEWNSGVREMLKPQPVSPPSHTMRPHVLIIDDDQSQVDELASLVASLGFSYVTAANGLEGLSHIQQNANIGILLLDVFMPEINGLDILKRLRNAYYRRRNLQCVLLSGTPQFDHVVEGLERGAISFLIKPVTYLDLKGQLAKAAVRYEEARYDDAAPLEQGFRECLTSLGEVLLQIRRIETIRDEGLAPDPVGLLKTLSLGFGERTYGAPSEHALNDKTYQGNTLANFVNAAKLFTNVQIALENLNLSPETLRILIEIVVAKVKGQALPVSALCHAASVPQTTALRRIDELARKGLIEKSADQKDGRRLLVTLTPQGVSRLSQVGALFR